MKTRNLLRLTGLALLAATGLQAQIFNFENERSHNHYSIETLDDDLVMAGTLFPNGTVPDHDVHAQRVNSSGSVIWENTFDIGNKERCMGMTVHDDVVVLTGTVDNGGNNEIFVMRLDASSGALQDYVTLPSSGSPYVDQIGRDIVYNADREQYFIGGWGTDDINTVFNEGGLLIALDNNLDPVWSREIPGGRISTVVDMEGRGLFVTGRYANSFSYTMAMGFDYGGSTMWQQNTNLLIGTSAVYDANTDIIYMTSQNHVAEIKNAGTGAATITQSRAYGLVSNLGIVNLETIYDIKLNPNTNQLAVLAGLKEDGQNVFNYFPTMIMLDKSNLTVQSASFLQTVNFLYLVNDDAHFNARLSHTNTNSLISYNNGFAYVGYEGMGAGSTTYSLNAVITDATGRVSGGAPCNLDASFNSAEPKIHFVTAPVRTITHNKDSRNAINLNESHDMRTGCFPMLPCNVTVNSLQKITNIDCLTAEFEVNASTSVGSTITQYFWDWGDGTTTTTTTPTAQHFFSIFNQGCVADVCVTVTSSGVNGATCTDQMCLQVNVPFFTSINGFPCLSCDNDDPEKWGENSDAAFDALAAKISLTPNPASDFITFSGLEGMMNITITDAQGRTVFTGAVQESKPLNVSAFENGIYFVTGKTSEGGSFSKKFVVN